MSARKAAGPRCAGRAGRRRHGRVLHLDEPDAAGGRARVVVSRLVREPLARRWSFHRRQPAERSQTAGRSESIARPGAGVNASPAGGTALLDRVACYSRTGCAIGGRVKPRPRMSPTRAFMASLVVAFVVLSALADRHAPQHIVTGTIRESEAVSGCRSPLTRRIQRASQSPCARRRAMRGVPLPSSLVSRDHLVSGRWRAPFRGRQSACAARFGDTLKSARVDPLVALRYE